MALKDGALIEGRYEIVRAVTSGGMGSLYEAKDLNSGGTRCAIKKMLEHLVEVEESALFRAKFEAETSFLCTLNHEGIPRLYNAFVRDSTYYIVMEFVQGPNLEQELQERVRLTGAAFPPDVLVEDACQILEILRYLHEQNPPLIHRDVKPANLIREYPSGRIKLVDFGLARSLTGDKKTMTQIGTLGYSPLEQLQGRPDATSDLYALGVTMHHLLTGVVPTPLSIPPILELAPTLDGELAQIIDKACSPKPPGRYASAALMGEALRRWQLERPPSVALAAQSAAEPEPARAAPTAPRRGDPRRGFLTRLMKSGEDEAALPPGPIPESDPSLAGDPIPAAEPFPAPAAVAVRAPLTRPEKARPTTFLEQAPPTRLVTAELLTQAEPAARAPWPWRRAAAVLVGSGLLIASAWFALPPSRPGRVASPTPLVALPTPSSSLAPLALRPSPPKPSKTPVSPVPRTAASARPTPKVVMRAPTPSPRESGESFQLGGPAYPAAASTTLPKRPTPPSAGNSPPRPPLPAGELDRKDLGLQVGLDQAWTLNKNTRASTSRILFTAGSGEAFDPLQSLEITSGQVVYPARRVQNSFLSKRAQWTPLEVDSMDLAVERQAYGKQELEALVTRSQGAGTRYYVVRYEVKRGKWSPAKFREEALKALEQVKID